MSEHTKRERGNYTLPGQEGKGFQQIPNEIWREFLRFQGSRHELQVFGAIFELTVNWKHEWQRIANKTLGSKTRIPPNKICEATGSLVRRKMIRQNTVYAEDSRGRTQRFNEFSINPKVSEWDVSPKLGIPQPRQRTGHRFDAVSIPRFDAVSIPETGEHPRNSLQKSKLYMSGMTPGRTDSLSENPLRRNHPLDDKEKAEFSRTLREFDPVKFPGKVIENLLECLKYNPLVNHLYVLEQRISLWKKNPKLYEGRHKDTRRQLLDAFDSATRRIKKLPGDTMAEDRWRREKLAAEKD